MTTSLADAEVLAVDGTPTKVGTLWAARPVVLVFLRHFGWMFCRELAAQVRGVNDRIEAKGARVVFIGNGSPLMAAAFQEDFDVRSPLYTDPSLQVYKAAELKRGLGSILGAIKNAPRALIGGHLQGRTQGDPLQQGGVLVVDTTGAIRYRFTSGAAGDHPNLEDVIAKLPS